MQGRLRERLAEAASENTAEAMLRAWAAAAQDALGAVRQNALVAEPDDDAEEGQVERRGAGKHDSQPDR